MTKTKRQLRAEAVERLKNSMGARLKPDAAVIAIVGGRIGLSDWSLECDKLIDLLTDDCGPCYSCAKLAELMAENNALRGKVDELANDGKAPEKVVTTESVGANDANAALDSREKLEADVERLIPTESGEIDTSKDDMRDFDDSREKLERDILCRFEYEWHDGSVDEDEVIKWLDRQAAIDRKEFQTILEEIQKCVRNGSR